MTTIYQIMHDGDLCKLSDCFSAKCGWRVNYRRERIGGRVGSPVVLFIIGVVIISLQCDDSISVMCGTVDSRFSLKRSRIK